MAFVPGLMDWKLEFLNREAWSIQQRFQWFFPVIDPSSIERLWSRVSKDIKTMKFPWTGQRQNDFLTVPVPCFERLPLIIRKFDMIAQLSACGAVDRLSPCLSSLHNDMAKQSLLGWTSKVKVFRMAIHLHQRNFFALRARQIAWTVACCFESHSD